MNLSGSWKNRARQAVEFVFSSLALMSLAGCRMPEMQTRVKLDSASGIFDSANVTYRLDAGRIGEPIAVSRVQGQLVSYEDKATPPKAAAAVGTLTVEYPHPEGIAGMAQARVVLETHKTAKPTSSSGATAAMATAVNGTVDWMTSPWSKDTASYEVWVLDIPKIEFDRVVADLSDQGYFSPVASNTKTTPGIDVIAKIDGRKVKRQWKQVGTLDALMLQVRQSGQLETYRRPATASKSQVSPTSSVAAYRKFLASESEAQQMLAKRDQPTINVRSPETPTQIAAVSPQVNAQQPVAQPTAPPQVVAVQRYAPPAAYVPPQPTAPPQVATTAPTQVAVTQPYVPPAAYSPPQPTAPPQVAASAPPQAAATQPYVPPVAYVVPQTVVQSAAPPQVAPAQPYVPSVAYVPPQPAAPPQVATPASHQVAATQPYAPPVAYVPLQPVAPSQPVAPAQVAVTSPYPTTSYTTTRPVPARQVAATNSYPSTSYPTTQSVARPQVAVNASYPTTAYPTTQPVGQAIAATASPYPTTQPAAVAQVARYAPYQGATPVYPQSHTPSQSTAASLYGYQPSGVPTPQQAPVAAQPVQQQARTAQRFLQ